MIHSPAAFWYLALILLAVGSSWLSRRSKDMSVGLSVAFVLLLAVGLTGWI